MNVSTDYRGRKADVVAFRGFQPRGDAVLLSMELANHRDGGQVVGGVQKLAQEFLVRLLTVQGTVAGDPAFGSRFLRDAAVGNWRTVADVLQSFAIARAAVRAQIVAAEQAGDPPDERYGGSSAESVILADGHVTIRVRMRSLAGDSYTFLAPVPTPLR